jgi:conjugal transfer pilus assembly protein TraK
MKKKAFAIAVSVLFSAGALAESIPANKTVAPMSPGFMPPGLDKMKQQSPDQENNDPEQRKAADKTPEIKSSLMSVPKDKAIKPKIKSREEITAAEARQFRPTGNNVVVSEAKVVPQEFPAEPENLASPARMDAVVNAKAGEPVNIPISIGVLNRIVTPFKDAVVDTVSNLQVKKAGGVIMVATSSSEPASVIIREKEDPESAVLINLVPLPGVPARDVRINAPFVKRASSRDEDGAATDIATPTVIKLKNVMRDIAKGKIPSGFSLEKGSGKPAECRLPGIATREAQVLSGSTMTVHVYAATNIADGENELDERGCASKRQLAASAWPRISLRKGERTELYVIQTPEREEDTQIARPSVIE